MIFFHVSMNNSSDMQKRIFRKLMNGMAESLQYGSVVKKTKNMEEKYYEKQM